MNFSGRSIRNNQRREGSIVVKHESVALTNIGTSMEERAKSVLSDSLRSVRRWLKRAAREWTDNDELVHQLRVSGRHALSALILFEVLLPEPEVRWFRKQLKSILQAAGRARDLDLLISRQLTRCGKARKFMAKHWFAERSAAQKQLMTLFRKLNQNDRFRKHKLALIRNLKTSAVNAEHVAQRINGDRILPQFADRCSSVVNALGNEADVHTLHELRIAVKRLRYAATPLLPVLKDQKLPDLIKGLEGLQTQLGEMHDHVVAEQEVAHPFGLEAEPLVVGELRQLRCTFGFEKPTHRVVGCVGVTEPPPKRPSLE